MGNSGRSHVRYVGSASAARIGPCGRTSCLCWTTYVLIIDCRRLNGLANLGKSFECRGDFASSTGISWKWRELS